MKQLVIFIGIIFFMACSGCLYIPTPEFGGWGQEIKKEKLGFIVPGKTKKEEVLLNLGQPDRILFDEPVFFYFWERNRDFWMLIPVDGRFGTRHHLIEIFFDDQGTVCSFEVKAGFSLNIEDEAQRLEKGPPCPSSH